MAGASQVRRTFQERLWSAMVRSADTKIDGGNKDRRREKRYPIPLELCWKLIEHRKTQAEGTGRTIDLSSGGLLIEADRPLPFGMNIEIAVFWPAVFSGNVAMQLKVTGQIVRSSGTLAAISRKHYEFSAMRPQRWCSSSL